MHLIVLEQQENNEASVASVVNDLLRSLKVAREKTAKVVEDAENFQSACNAIVASYHEQAIIEQLKLVGALFETSRRLQFSEQCLRNIAEHAYHWISRALELGVDRTRLQEMESFHNQYSPETYETRKVKGILLQAMREGFFIEYVKGMTEKEAIDLVNSARRAWIESGGHVREASRIEPDLEDMRRLFDEINDELRQKERAMANCARRDNESLRDLYRMLIRWLHPDREQDVELKKTKTELMQRVNIAFRNGDIGSLLLLRLEALQVEGIARGVDIKEAQVADVIKQINKQIKEAKSEATLARNEFRDWMCSRFGTDSISKATLKSAIVEIKNLKSSNLHRMRTRRTCLEMGRSEHSVSLLIRSLSSDLFR